MNELNALASDLRKGGRAERANNRPRLLHFLLYDSRNVGGIGRNGNALLTPSASRCREGEKGKFAKRRGKELPCYLLVSRSADKPIEGKTKQSDSADVSTFARR